MNPEDEKLNRLLKSAAAAPRPPSGAAAFVLEARVLAHWRASQADDDGAFLVAWFRRAAICGCVLAVASLAWTQVQRTDVGGGAMAVADSAMQMGVEP
ncbi:MAG TPA: hypothetical protein VG754_08210 [Verrucomicrobiae bacterium]|nr:hypothetical protein [Verrucomicrobiae bacterium]